MRRSRPTEAIALLAALVSTSACATSIDGEASEPRVAQPKATESASTPPKSTATAPSSVATTPPSATTSSPAEQDSSPGRAQQAQIPAEQLPGFNEEWRWTATRRVQNATSLCMLSSLESIGAVNQVSTKFTSSASKTTSAVQITGVFPDEHTALTAVAVLDAWQGKCADYAAQDVGLNHVEVSDQREVTTSVGSGRQWMVTYRPVPGQPDSVWFDSEGFVRDGDTLTYVLYKSAGQDYNYETGQEPIDRALAVAGDYLERTRGG